MGIGTSLGAYFETALDHHSSNEYLTNPNSTPDNNELSTNEVMPKSDEEPKVIPISDIKTASPLVTITDEDIDKAINLGMSFTGGGLSTTKKVSQGILTKENSIGNVHEFSFPTKSGKGNLVVEKYNMEQHGDNSLYVRSIASDEGPNTLGVSQVREILKNLQDVFPEATSIRGYRVSGARRIPDKAEAPLKGNE